MAETAETVHSLKTASDGTVKIAIEKYNELLEKAAVKPPVINRTTVIKTSEMLAKEYRMWGIAFIGLGTGMVVVGGILIGASRTEA